MSRPVNAAPTPPEWAPMITRGSDFCRQQTDPLPPISPAGCSTAAPSRLYCGGDSRRQESGEALDRVRRHAMHG